MKLKRLLSCFLALAMMTSMVSFQTSAYEGSSNNEGYTIDEPYEYPMISPYTVLFITVYPFVPIQGMNG